MPPDSHKINQGKVGWPFVHKVANNLPSPPPSLVRTLRLRWMCLTPWILLVLQSVVVALLVTELRDKDSLCMEHHNKDPPEPCPEVDMVAGAKGHDNTADFEKLVRSSTVIDKRLLKELPIKVPQNVSRIFYNRVPKCGSSTMMDLMTEMGNIHNFTFWRDGVFMRFYLDDFYQKRLVTRLMSYPPPMIYERHFHFIDFTQFNFSQPVYINLVRDPLDRLVSWYYFRRFQDGHVRDMPTAKRVRTYDECVLDNHSECVDPLGDEPEEGYFKLIPFFCGQESFCRQPTERALVQAIWNVKQHFTVVGYLEEYHKFVEVLEYILPDFFRGASKVFEVQAEMYRHNHKTTYKLPISKEVENIMYKKLQKEYQFYLFIKHRFQNLYSAIDDVRKKLKR